MSSPAATRPGPARPVLLVAAGLAALGGTGLMLVGGSRPSQPPFVASTSVPSPEGSTDLPAAQAVPDVPAPAGASRADLPAAAAAQGLARSTPVSIDVPAIGLRTRLGVVGQTADHRIDVPAAKGGQPAYWYRLLASPGEPGPAVVVGHVDSAAAGAGVFYRLGELRPGDVVTVHREDGTAPRFVVRQVARYAKRAFPTDLVYGRTTVPALRLVTCGGTFDRRAGSYRDNVVVFADLTS